MAVASDYLWYGVHLSGMYVGAVKSKRLITQPNLKTLSQSRSGSVCTNFPAFLPAPLLPIFSHNNLKFGPINNFLFALYIDLDVYERSSVKELWGKGRGVAQCNERTCGEIVAQNLLLQFVLLGKQQNNNPMSLDAV